MKKILAALMVTTFAFCVGTAFAKKENCTVKATEVKDEKTVVTIECAKDSTLKVDDNLKIKVVKQQPVEGC
ncbi:hypothetical protein VU04_06305 [Desulfobulbus sp. TB]|nr:hypothetical protein [Desulfobulbus sp. TB]